MLSEVDERFIYSKCETIKLNLQLNPHPPKPPTFKLICIFLRPKNLLKNKSNVLSDTGVYYMIQS